jgi:deoxyribonuclease-1
MKTVLTIGLYLLALDCFANITFYPNTTIEKFNSPDTTSQELLQEIFNLSEKIHIKHNDQNDTLDDLCPANAECTFQKKDATYEQARKLMFGQLFLETSSNGKYLLKEVYCNITVDESAGIGPNKIPNPKYINCEHTWPQSKFSKNFSAELQKSDLHHLFPSDMKANSTRNNYPFADVLGKITHANCLDSKIGNAISSPNVRSFEPPIEHKGNVARAIYYFSTRYKMNIDSTQARYLKIWNEEDPVDEAERERNNKIMQLQGNRNPFIDYPELINRL